MRNRRARHAMPSLHFLLFCVVLCAAVYIAAYSVGNHFMSSGQDQRQWSVAREGIEQNAGCQRHRQQLSAAQAAVEGALADAERTQQKMSEEMARAVRAAGECAGEQTTRERQRPSEEQTMQQEDTAAVNPSCGMGLGEMRDLAAATARELQEQAKTLNEKRKLQETCNNAMQRYSVVFDAGSTGSRVHVFRYNLTANPYAGNTDRNLPRPSLMPFLRLDDELFVENHDPLSGFDNASDAAASLAPLLDAARAYVPESLHACVPIELKATAGLRRVGHERADAVLNAVRRLFQNGPFWQQSEWDSVRILEGREEGPLAWLTVNYLLGTLSRDAPLATTVDLGGGSTQIVMCPTDASVLNAHAEFTHVFKMNGRSFVVYQHSYEGNGLHAAKEQLLKAVVAAASPDAPGERNTTEATASHHASSEIVLLDLFPCFPKGYVDKKSGVSNSRSGGQTPSMEACVALFERYVVRGREACGSESCGFNGVFQPNVSTASKGPVYAFSFYCDRLKPHITGEVIRVQDVADIASRVCLSMKTAEEFLKDGVKAKKMGSLTPEMECFELSYLFALLRHGFGFPYEQQLHIAKKINGFETAWALGASLVTLEGQIV